MSVESINSNYISSEITGVDFAHKILAYCEVEQPVPFPDELGNFVVSVADSPAEATNGAISSTVHFIGQSEDGRVIRGSFDASSAPLNETLNISDAKFNPFPEQRSGN